MDRTDPEQEGITLPPVNSVRLIARDEAYRAIHHHSKICQFSSDDFPERLRNLEVRFALWIGLMIGSGLLGGTVGAFLSRLLP